MARVEAVPAKEAGWFGRLVYRLVRKRFGDVMEPVAVARHHRGVFRASVLHEGMVERSLRVLPAPLRALVVYRVATVLGCSWCVDFGAMKMRLDGLDIERLVELDEYRDSTAFDATEKAALAYADGMTASPPHVTDEQVRELTELFGRDGLVELTYVIALENARARFNDALGIRDQGFLASCRVPA